MKRLAVFFLFVSVALLAQANYLYWTTQDSPSWAINGSGQFNFDYASVMVSETGQALQSYYLEGEDPMTAEKKEIEAFADGKSWGYKFFVDVTDLAGKSFYIEYYVYDSAGNRNVTGMSQVESYADLMDAGYISDDMSMDPALGTWLGSGYMVPEPTGGVLLLLGLGLLGLRRRRNREVA